MYGAAQTAKTVHESTRGETKKARKSQAEPVTAAYCTKRFLRHSRVIQNMYYSCGRQLLQKYKERP